MNNLKYLTFLSVLFIAMISTIVKAQDTNKTIATDLLLKGLLKADKSYIQNHVAKDYIQHNPMAEDGQQGLLKFVNYLKALKTPATIKPIRILQDGDLVAIQSEYRIGVKLVVFDLFRFQDSKIVEHWDGSQAFISKTVSGRSMLDGPTQILDKEKTDQNRQLVTNFIQDILIAGKADQITTYIGKTYHQHNPAIADGLEGLGAFLKHLQKQKISFSYKKMHNIVAEGNFVMTQSEGEIGGKPKAFFDLFRVREGKIVEHWDVIQDIPEKMPHNNGMF